MMRTTKLFLPFFIICLGLVGTDVWGQNNNKTQVIQNKKVYTCPMHPEVVKESPDKCPKCGMQLEIQKESQKTVPKDNTKMKKEMADTTKINHHNRLLKDSMGLDKKTIPDSLKKMMDK